MKSKIGFIGLGNMGLPMAANLLKAGYQVSIFDINQAPVQRLAMEGAIGYTSVNEAVTEVDIVMTMLPSSPHVEQVYCATDGVLASIKHGTILIDSSTIDPLTSRKVAEKASKQGNIMMDTPVSGGTVGAENGTLTFMVGGVEDTFEIIKPFLEDMGKNIVYCGASGNGQVAKLCNNMLLGISMIGVSEAMTLGVKLGIDPKVLADIINTSSGRCWSSDTYNPYPDVMDNVPAARGYTGGFGGDLMLKDLTLATASAKNSHHPVFLGALAQQLYQVMSSKGDGHKDFSSIINLYNKD